MPAPTKAASQPIMSLKVGMIAEKLCPADQRSLMNQSAPAKLRLPTVMVSCRPGAGSTIRATNVGTIAGTRTRVEGNSSRATGITRQISSQGPRFFGASGATGFAFGLAPGFAAALDAAISASQDHGDGEGRHRAA